MADSVAVEMDDAIIIDCWVCGRRYTKFPHELSHHRCSCGDTRFISVGVGFKETIYEQ
jgi:hypothetical protein